MALVSKRCRSNGLVAEVETSMASKRDESFTLGDPCDLLNLHASKEGPISVNEVIFR
jgi:hypothetical protein